MIAPDPDVPAPSPLQPADSVFSRLVTDIVSGRYPMETRLPAERELARRVGASRPTLREALRRMEEWGLIETKRGSGIRVQHHREWALEVLPILLAQNGDGRGQLIADMLSLRHRLMVVLVAATAGRLTADGIDTARNHLLAAWDARRDSAAFIESDIAFYKSLFEAANMVPALWMFNSVARVYRTIADTFGAAVAPQPHYVDALSNVLDALDTGDGQRASQTLDNYFRGIDSTLRQTLQSEASQ